MEKHNASSFKEERESSSSSSDYRSSTSVKNKTHPFSSKDSGSSPKGDKQTNKNTSSFIDTRFVFLDKLHSSSSAGTVTTNKEILLTENTLNDSMKFHGNRTRKRSRSSQSSSSDDLASTNKRSRLSSKKNNKYEAFQESTAKESSDHMTNTDARGFVMVPVSYPSASDEGHSSRKRSFQNFNSPQNCCTSADKYNNRSKELSSDRRYIDGSTSVSPLTYGKKGRFGSTSDCSSPSPNFMTPQRKYSEASPRFTSPMASFLSPRSTFRGLDQPSAWGRDLIARSQNYKNTFIDSHCHIDLLYDRLGIPHTTPFSEFRKMVASSVPTNFEGCVAIFCYPKTYSPYNPQNTLLQTLTEDADVWFSLGCHPKSATEFSAKHEQGLKTALAHPKVVALGEIGLDYSGTFYRHAETQKAVLRRQLQMALDLQLPLVLHCRDAYDDCLIILKEMVPRTWRIHLHCFCGNMEVADIWMDTFPNLYIGLTPVITYRSAYDSINSARHIPLNRLLLETDSPYFVPGSIKESKVHVSHPGLTLFTAERLAELKNVTVDTVLYNCRMNTRMMYNI